MTWQDFVLEFGRGAHADHLSAVLDQPKAAIARLRDTVSCRRGPRRGFPDLFARWRGRPPQDEDWPAPRRAGGNGYEWLAPELALVARLAGRFPPAKIAEILTARLRKLTGDAAAMRNRLAVQGAINRLGLQASEALGGLTTTQLAKRVGSLAVVHQAIHCGQLRSFRVGRLHVVPHDVAAAWLAARDRVPAGYVRLASLQRPLGIRSDSKLPEYAKLGYIPGAVFVRSSHLWVLPPATARAIVEAAHDGRPLPWYGKPHPANTAASWRKWRQRRHRRCRICATAWGQGGAPRTFADFRRRYPALDLGLKRHLTMRRARRHRGPRQRWGLCRVFRAQGVTIPEAARALHKPVTWVWGMIDLGIVRPVRSATDPGQPVRITPAGMERLRAARTTERRGRPAGEWVGVHAAAMLAGVSITTVERWRQLRLVTSKPGPRGRLYGLATLTANARCYWEWAATHFKRATPPAWLQAV